MTNGLEYLGTLWAQLREVYDGTLPATMPEGLRGSEKAQSAIREARHAVHEAMCHIGDASIVMHKEEPPK